jgi:hypothetical protein
MHKSLARDLAILYQSELFYSSTDFPSADQACFSFVHFKQCSAKTF